MLDQTLLPGLGPVSDHEFLRAFQGHADDVAFRDTEVIDQLVLSPSPAAEA